MARSSLALGPSFLGRVPPERRTFVRLFQVRPMVDFDSPVHAAWEARARISALFAAVDRPSSVRHQQAAEDQVEQSQTHDH
ncbi:hypothetical protein EEJ42_09220 [Streptomyces botrytidirepellens]|uniref:Uncharacterized protein n=1 Tax=Streptomyces botrytidirepellens TaxID=2486417 RepID=A0A3M8WLL0_9ACTN|nr:hypothetical protein EEJ42_09220 [Streptomyces botrytidirepellens]